jgi:NAD(P)-dependent dehydrogenase (short-subunit alcohol dehydrogenase family)
MEKSQKTQQPPQHQNQQPGIEEKMDPQPIYISPNYKGSEKLKGKVALITGGDSGIGRAVACHFAKEGADIIINYLNEHVDAQKTQSLISSYGRKCWLLPQDLQSYQGCENLAQIAIEKAGKINILVNNAAVQYPKETIEDISCDQLEQTFKINFFAYFYMIKALLPQFSKGDIIINTTSVTAYKGSHHLLDYSATKGAIIALTRSLSQNLASKGIRVNAVAPGPIWTPLIPASFDAEKVEQFGNQAPMQRAGQPYEVAPAFVYLASSDSSYMTGQVLHPNGGIIVNS